MELHHKKHHAAYVANLNIASEKLDTAISQKDIKSVIGLQSAIKFNGGGHINHGFFWNCLTPSKSSAAELKNGKLRLLMSGSFKSALERDFGSVEAFKTAFSAASAGVQGSGWGWLGFNKVTQKLEISTTPNQDPLLHLEPLLGNYLI